MSMVSVYCTRYIANQRYTVACLHLPKRATRTIWGIMYLLPATRQVSEWTAWSKGAVVQFMHLLFHDRQSEGHHGILGIGTTHALIAELRQGIADLESLFMPS